jgi:hypothetical protein
MKLAQFGQVTTPPGVSSFGAFGLPTFISVILRTLVVGAGLYALVNFILAGYAFLSAGGDPQKISNASQKITLSIIGLLIAAGSFVIAAIIGKLIFNDPQALLRIRIYGP